MATAVQELLDILDLEPLEVNLFRGRSPQIALAARVRRPGDRPGAGRGLPHGRGLAARPPHSLHAYFLLGGDPKVPIIYEVDRIRDGKSFTTRRVVAIQHGQAIFSMSVSFHGARAGTDRIRCQMPDVPTPGRSCRAKPRSGRKSCRGCPSRCAAITSASGRSNCGRSSSAATLGETSAGRALQHLDADHRRAAGRSGDPSMRAGLCLGHDVARHRADCRIQRSVFDRDIMAASLDHALWFHRPFRADEWLLYAQDSPNLARLAAASRRGLIFAERRHAGRLGRPGGSDAGAQELTARP